MTKESYLIGDDPWVIGEETHIQHQQLLHETLFFQGNGTIGMRGNLEEGYRGEPGNTMQGTYMNGFFDSLPIVYGEAAYGYAKSNETMLNLPDAQGISLTIDDEIFNLDYGKVLNYKRELHMKKGVVTRLIRWKSPKGKEVSIEIKRLIPFEMMNLALIDYRVTPLNFSGDVMISSTLETSVFNKTHDNDPRIGASIQGRLLIPEKTWVNNHCMGAIHRTKFNLFTLITEVDHQHTFKDGEVIEEFSDDGILAIKFHGWAKENVTYGLTKIIAYHSTKENTTKSLKETSRQALEEAKKLRFNEFENMQREYLKDFWQKAFMEVEGDPLIQQGMHFNLFHLLQSAGKDGATSIAAKGLSGEGYNGHYFWDTEIYIFPVFLYTKPDLARNLLMFRYKTLDKARERAREMDHKKGALYPWRTIDGSESSAYYPAGTAQYHINADIIYAIKKYVEGTGDENFLKEFGLEMILETARVWLDLGHFNPRRNNHFEIYNVTGPDEYTAMVNNNFFTNAMAKMHLLYAYESAKWFQSNSPDEYRSLMNKINMTEEELFNFQRAAENMFFSKDELLGIYPQDDSFLNKPKWDFENRPKEKTPLLLHYHPLNIYRHQVLKQADVVLALFLLSENYTIEEKKKNFDYYEPITTHDSSLSYCMYSILASEIGYDELAYEFFRKTVRMDLDNVLGKTHHGIHTANMGGAWMAMVYGFAGMRTNNINLSFSPSLPKDWKGYRFRITFRGSFIEVEVKENQVLYTLLQGKSIEFYHNSQCCRLWEEQPREKFSIAN